MDCWPRTQLRALHGLCFEAAEPLVQQRPGDSGRGDSGCGAPPTQPAGVQDSSRSASAPKGTAFQQRGQNKGHAFQARKNVKDAPVETLAWGKLATMAHVGLRWVELFWR